VEVAMGSKELEQLRDLLVGATVDRIDPPDKGVTEAIAKFTVHKGARRHEFHLHATDLGWWIGEHESVTTDPDGSEVRTYIGFYKMVDQMVNHLISDAMADHLDEPGDAPLFVALDDSKTRRVGFRCKVTGKEWWISISQVGDLDSAPHIRELLNTPTGRDKLADFIGTHVRLPKPEEVSS
jgi:hypothetical protein